MGEGLRVRVLGEFRLEGSDLGRLRSRKARTLLKILALHRGAVVSVDALVDAVWDDGLPADPARDLSVLVSRARTVLGNDRVVRRDGGYALTADWVDRDEVIALTREATRRHGSGDISGARVAAEAALALGAAPLLVDEPDAEWARQPRHEIAAVIAEARGIAAAAALAAGQAGEAAAHARAALSHDPFDETALRMLMRAHVAAGRPASALAAYAKARERLADELGVSPMAETEALHDAIVLGEPTSGAAAAPGEDVLDARRHERDPGLAVVGRDAELKLLDAAFERSRHRAEVVVVTGEAGAGKTTVIDAWAARARDRGVLVIAGRGHGGLDLALQPVLDGLAAALPSTDPGKDAGPIDASWIGVPGPAATSAALQHEVFEGLGDTLRSVTPPAGLAVVIDDVHLADPLTLAWLASLLRRPADHRLLVVTARRSEDDDVEVPASAVIDIGPLDRNAVAEMFGSDRAPVLLRRTGGNALLLFELARADTAGAGMHDGHVPATIREAVLARLRRVGDGTAATLRTAAVLGSTIDLDLLAGVLGASSLDVLAHLDEGVRRSFLIEAEGQLMFRHDLVRAALEAEATTARRSWIHREALALLDRRADANPLDRARHARAAGDPVRSADALADAADIARSRFDLDGAARLLDDAVATNDGAPLRLRRSRLRLARGDMDGADHDAEIALGLGAGAKALELRAWVARNRHDMDTAIRLGTAGADMAVNDPPTRASCLVAVALAYRGVGDLRAADRVMAAAGDLHPPPMLGIAAWEAALRVHQGRPLDALAALEPVLGAEAGGLLSFWVEHVMQMLAHAYGHIGRSTDALRMLDRFDFELERRGSAQRYAGASSTYRCWILRNLVVPGAVDLARASAATGATPEIRTQSLLDVADTLLSTGQLDEAGHALTEATNGMQLRWFHNRWRAEQRAGVITARLQLADGSTTDALATAIATTAAAEGRGDARYATIGRLLVARAKGRLGHPVDAGAVLTDVTALARVAALESWWLAADVADDTGVDAARALAEQFAGALAVDAGEHGDALRRGAARRFA